MVRYLECGCCGCYHKEDYDGECRDDNERYNLEELEFFSTTDDFEVVSLEQQNDISCGGYETVES